MPVGSEQKVNNESEMRKRRLKKKQQQQLTLLEWQRLSKLRNTTLLTCDLLPSFVPPTQPAVPAGAVVVGLG